MAKLTISLALMVMAFASGFVAYGLTAKAKARVSPLGIMGVFGLMWVLIFAELLVLTGLIVWRSA